MKRLRLLIFAVTSVACIYTATTYAEKDDRQQKIRISSLEGNADHANGIYKLEKDVAITQGTLHITANRGTVKTTPQDAYNASLIGKPVCFRQRTDKGSWAQGIADQVDYDSAKGWVELIGNAILFVGEDETRANYITYNTQTSTYEARESKDHKTTTTGKGVNFVLQPRAREDASSTEENSAPPSEKSPMAIKTETPPKRNESAFSRCA